MSKDLRYVNNEKVYLDYSFDVFGKYFSDGRVSFDAFYNKINEEEEKNKFLKISSFYKFLIIDGKFLNTEDKSYDEYIYYLDLTYKYIAIFSFIEALYTKDEYQEFYSWLKNQTTFPIATTKALDDSYKAYNEIHGSTRKAIRFFNSLDNETKKHVQEKVKVSNGRKSFSCIDENFARLFYEIRNKFIHNADLVVQFENVSKEEKLVQNGVKYEVPILFPMGNKEILSTLTFDDIKCIFEKGFLIYFGYDKADFKPK